MTGRVVSGASVAGPSTRARLKTFTLSRLLFPRFASKNAPFQYQRWLIWGTFVVILSVIGHGIMSAPLFPDMPRFIHWLEVPLLGTAILAVLVAAVCAIHALLRTHAPIDEFDASAAVLVQPQWAIDHLYERHDTPTFGALRAEQMSLIVGQLGLMMALNIVNALFFVVGVWTGADTATLLVWCAILVAYAVVGGMAWVRMRHLPRPETVSKTSVRKISMTAGVLGLLWGMGFALFFGQVSASQQIIVACTCMGMLAGGVAATSIVPGAAFRFGIGLMAPSLFRLVTLGGFDNYLLAALALAYFVAMVVIACIGYRGFAANFQARRHQEQQAETISLLLNEFESDAADWLWEADGDDRITRLNDRMADLCGVTKRDNAVYEMGELVANAAAITNAMAARVSFKDIVVKATDAGGQIHWMSLSGRPRRAGGYRGVASNITDKVIAQNAAELALRRAEAAERHLNDGIHALEAGFLLFDRNDRLVIFNDLVLESLGLVDGDLSVSMSVADFAAREPVAALVAHNAAFASWLNNWRQRADDELQSWDVELASGRWLRIQESETETASIVAIMTDVTDIKQQERELEIRAGRLKSVNNELKQFAAVAAHDLQEPLRKIEAFGSRLAADTSGDLSERNRNYLDRITDSSSRMRRLINDLLDHSRVGTADV